MNTKSINKEKKSNIKCEHCKWWTPLSMFDGLVNPMKICTNEKSNHYTNKRYYYNRCKCFEWVEPKENE